MWLLGVEMSTSRASSKQSYFWGVLMSSFFGGVEMSTTSRASSGITSERRYVFIMGVVMSSFWASSCLPSPKASIYLTPGHRPTA